MDPNTSQTLTTGSRETVRTRICIISDTHCATPKIPTCDLLLHCGDITVEGRLSEYRPQLQMLKEAPADLKLVIAGNHDITLDNEYYDRMGGEMHQDDVLDKKGLEEVREMWMGAETKRAGVIYLEEGTSSHTLRNGARFTVYSSPYQPEFCNWAFPYPRHEDRFNASPPIARRKAENPVPDFPAIDIMLTHGPPKGILDVTYDRLPVGCDHLRRADKRCRPLLHCFGHIHEGWGSGRMYWEQGDFQRNKPVERQIVKDEYAYLNLSEEDGMMPLKWGKETAFINASIMNIWYRPVNKPWVVDLDLPVRDAAS
ncbi:MAG: hypothetical protein Q9217_004213 [Psora testacea]